MGMFVFEVHEWLGYVRIMVAKNDIDCTRLLNNLGVEAIKISIRVFLVQVTYIGSFINCSGSLAMVNFNNLSICFEVSLMSQLTSPITTSSKFFACLETNNQNPQWIHLESCIRIQLNTSLY